MVACNFTKYELGVNSIFDIDSDFGRKGTDNERSTGMGLILCKEYENIVGAKLSVESIEEDIKYSKRD